MTTRRPEIPAISEIRGTGGTSAALAGLLGTRAARCVDLGHGITAEPAPPRMRGTDVAGDAVSDSTVGAALAGSLDLTDRTLDLTDRGSARAGRHRAPGGPVPTAGLLLAALATRHHSCGGWTGSSGADPRWRCLECGEVPAEPDRESVWVDVALTDAPVPRAVHRAA